MPCKSIPPFETDEKASKVYSCMTVHHIQVSNAIGKVAGNYLALMKLSCTTKSSATLHH